MDCYAWHNVKEETPADRAWVLIVHPDYETPMKAFYRDDCPGASWIFYTRSGRHSVYEWETDVNGELIVKWWRPLPDLPQREERKEELIKSDLRQAVAEISKRFSDKYCCSIRVDEDDVELSTQKED